MKKRCRQRRKDVDKERRQGRKKRKKERWQTRKKIQTKMMIQGKKDVDKEADKMQTIRIKMQLYKEEGKMLTKKMIQKKR